MSHYFVYILLCENGNYYTGYTSDMSRRYAEHLAGTTKSKYTRSFKPVKLAACWQIPNRGLAMKIEAFIKKLTKQQKTQLIKAPDSLMTNFADIAAQIC